MPRRIVVTGAARGIGLAIVKHLLEGGDAVLCIDRDAAKLGEVVAALRADHGDRVESLELDLSDSQAISALASHPWAGGPLDGLVCNAALAIQKLLPDLSMADLQNTWAVNMLAPILLVRSWTPALERARGSVVLITSVATRRPSPTYALYAASKAFLECLVRHAATELGPRGIRINCVSPGGVQTELMDEVNRLKGISPEELRKTTEKIPIEQRWARPSEIAECVSFALFGPVYLHGETIRIDGGIY